jgi:hypothetical protein
MWFWKMKIWIWWDERWRGRRWIKVRRRRGRQMLRARDIEPSGKGEPNRGGVNEGGGTPGRVRAGGAQLISTSISSVGLRW